MRQLKHEWLMRPKAHVAWHEPVLRISFWGVVSHACMDYSSHIGLNMDQNSPKENWFFLLLTPDHYKTIDYQDLVFLSNICNMQPITHWGTISRAQIYKSSQQLGIIRHAVNLTHPSTYCVLTERSCGLCTMACRQSWGSNPRFVHTFCDEDQMQWLRRSLIWLCSTCMIFELCWTCALWLDSPLAPIIFEVLG